MWQLGLLSIHTDRILTIILLSVTFFMLLGYPLFQRGIVAKRWFRRILVLLIAGFIGTFMYHLWSHHHGLSGTYYTNLYFTGEALQNGRHLDSSGQRKDRVIDFSSNDFGDRLPSLGGPISVKWEGYIYFPTSGLFPDTNSSLVTSLSVDGKLVQFPKSSIDLGTVEARKALGKGWSFDESVQDADSSITFVWSSGDRSNVFLGAPVADDYVLSFQGLQYEYLQSPAQKVTISVNGVILETVTMEKGWRWKTYRVNVPKSVIEQGEAGIVWVQFEYSDAIRPYEIVKESSDKRKLAIAVDRISLEASSESRQGIRSSEKEDVFSEGVHHVRILATGLPTSPHIRLGWRTQSDENMLTIREDYLFPKTEEKMSILRRLPLEHTLLGCLLTYKTLLLVLIFGLLGRSGRGFFTSNKGGVEQFRRIFTLEICERYYTFLLQWLDKFTASPIGVFFGKYDRVILSGLRPLCFIVYFMTEGFFLYQWDDQHSYFDVAVGLLKLDPIRSRFTLGFPAILTPFIKVFQPENFTQLVLPFSIFNAFILGTLSVYLVFRIVELLTRSKWAARISTFLFAIHPFLPFWAETKYNAHLQAPVFFGDISGWNMTSDHIGSVFIILAVFFMIKNAKCGASLLLPGFFAGYVGLIRMPNLVIILPLCYIAYLYRANMKMYAQFFVSMSLVLFPQFVYNWYYFGGPLKFGYMVDGHVSRLWNPELIVSQIHTVRWDHYLSFVLFFLVIILTLRKPIGSILILWVYPFVIYYAGYQHLYNDPVRFLVPIRPALCIAIGGIVLWRESRVERFFVMGSLLTVLLCSSYYDSVGVPTDLLPVLLVGICFFLTAITVCLGISLAVSLPLYLFVGWYFYFVRLEFIPLVVFSIICAVLNVIPVRQCRLD